MHTCMDNGDGRPWCNPSQLHEIPLGGGGVAVDRYCLTANPRDCTCPTCAPHAAAILDQVREAVEAVVAAAKAPRGDLATVMLLDLVHGDPMHVGRLRLDAASYLEDLHPTFCPCLGLREDQYREHIPSCPMGEED